MIQKIKLGMFALVLMMSATAYGRSAEESAMLLQQAMMQSNADYNKHKLQDNLETFDRADSWSEREASAIHLNKGATIGAAQWEEFKDLRDDLQPDQRELSSHQD